MRKKKQPSFGMIQVYTGDGKGKTTAALGLALRAAGHGLRVLVIQFLKGGIAYGELESAKRLNPFLRIVPAGRESFVDPNDPAPEDRRLARKGWMLAQRAVMEGRYAIVVLDEINVAVHYGLISLANLLTLMAKKPPHVELVLTGRWAKSQVIRRADLVTEMKEIKHYYQKGVAGRIGIER